jgi:hypothetical protein
MNLPESEPSLNLIFSRMRHDPLCRENNVITVVQQFHYDDTLE